MEQEAHFTKKNSIHGELPAGWECIKMAFRKRKKNGKRRSNLQHESRAPTYPPPLSDSPHRPPIFTTCAGRKATSARQARALKALKRADDTAVAEIGGLLYEMPRGAAGGRVIAQITRRQLYGSDFTRLYESRRYHVDFVRYDFFCSIL